MHEAPALHPHFNNACLVQSQKEERQCPAAADTVLLSDSQRDSSTAKKLQQFQCQRGRERVIKQLIH